MDSLVSEANLYICMLGAVEEASTSQSSKRQDSVTEPRVELIGGGPAG
jgi:hypothetical protein